MGVNINCKQNDHGAWCKDRRVKRSLFGLGARVCAVFEQRSCAYQDMYERPQFAPRGVKPNASLSIPGGEPGYAPCDCWAIMVNPDYVNGRGQWSRANQCGYTMDWREAGRFSRQEAEETAAGSHGKYTAVPLADISEPNARLDRPDGARKEP